MLDESLVTLPLSKLKDVLLSDLSVSHLALIYVLMYVLYKALGRYVYFKPEEHSSKINRTFLVLALLIVVLHSLNWIISYFPFVQEYRWLYAISSLVLLTAPLSILLDRIIWKYDRYGQKNRRNWHHHYLPIPDDYYKTNISKSERDGNMSQSWEEEGVASTSSNVHSDALLNALALITFVSCNWYWALDSSLTYGYLSFIFFVGISLPVAGIFIDRGIFSWIDYLEENFSLKEILGRKSN